MTAEKLERGEHLLNVINLLSRGLENVADKQLTHAIYHITDKDEVHAKIAQLLKEFLTTQLEKAEKEFNEL
jgi:hypothetical protein